MVSEITVADVKKAFGGDEEGGYSRSVYSSYRSNANAYMLMYRQSMWKEKNEEGERERETLIVNEITVAYVKQRIALFWYEGYYLLYLVYV